MKKLLWCSLICVILISMFVPVSAKLLNINKHYSVGTTYVALTPSVTVGSNGYILYANTRPTSGSARLNLSQDGVSVSSADFPYQVAASPIYAKMYINKVYKVNVRALSGTTSGTCNYYTNK